MVSFDLQGRDVGPRILQAIRRAAAEDVIALHCAGAKFFAAFDLSDLELTVADFTGARFNHGIRLDNVKFRGDAQFDGAETSDFWLTDATFFGAALFRRLRSANLRVKTASFQRYASFDGAQLGLGSFRDVQFDAEARFRQLNIRGPLTFRAVQFSAAASFQSGELRQLACRECSFRGPLQTRALSVEETLELVGSSCSDTRLMELNAGSKIAVRNVSFAQSVALIVKAKSLDGTGTCFERGADILLEANMNADFEGASFLGPSSISTQTADGGRAKLMSLDRARAERLTLENLDLSQCNLARMHRLDDVLIRGRGQLALAPAVVEGPYRREVLADEVLRRAAISGRMLEWAPTKWELPSALQDQDPLEAQTISDTYRAMRKAREGAHDYPGAADFYYGEMEMRREGADSRIERAILTIYWLVSGYGLRASRAAIAFVFTVLLLAIGFQTIGLENPPSFWRTLGWTLSACVSLTKPVETMNLTTGGVYFNVAARVLGPVLIALVVLALRSRVRR